MSTRFHGVISIVLVFLAVLLAVVTGFLTSWGTGIAYIVVCVVGVGGILYAYCAKCPCRTSCGHVIPGKLASVLGNRQEGPYSGLELIAVGLALLAIVGLPQLWLWQYPIVAVAFLILVAVALIQIRARVCHQCGNNFCPARARSSRRPELDGDV